MGPPDQEYCPAAPSTTTPPTPRPTLPPTPMMSMSMSMNMDMNFKSLTLEDSFSIGDYLDGTIDVMEGRDSSPEFGYKGGTGGKGEKSGKPDFETKKGKNETKQEKNETKKEKTKLQKSEKDATKSEKKRLRI